MKPTEIKYLILKATLDALIEAAPGVVKAPAKFVSSLAEQLKDKSKKEGKPLEQVIRGIPKGELEAMIKEAGCDQKESIDFIVRAVGGIPDLFQKIEEQIRGLKEDHEEIKKLLRSMVRESLPIPLQFPLLPSLHNQTPPEPNFVGRVKMLKTITGWYQSKEVRIGALIGWGGVGKSALVRRWYDSLEENKIQPDGIFWWGFYRNAYLEAFLNELLRYLSQAQIDPDTIKSSWEKVERIKGYLNQGSYLIILDGLEQMQKSEDGFGEMIHPELRELLYYLADASTIGLCLITTRYPLKDLERWRRSSLRELPLVELSIPDALSMLKKRGVKGSDDEMIEVIKRYKAHALSLTSMAGFLNRYYEGDIKRAPDIEFVLSDEERFKDVNKLLRRYAEKMKEAELCFLHIFSLFRKEITEREFSGVFLHNMGFNEVLVKMDELDFKDLVDGLVDWRLISYDEKEKTYTTHPLIKGYFEQSFAEEDKRECHKRIYHYFGEIAKDEPKTLEEMKPLFEQVYHGCMAGLYDEVFDGVYWEKINRKEENFIIHSLGAWGTALSLIRNFFPKGDLTKMPRVSKKKDQSFLLNSAGLALLNIGRPKEAEEPFLTGVRMDIEEKDWENASAGYQNLADLQFRIGELEKALNSAEEALKMAEKARSDEDIMTSKAYLGQILYLLGKSKEAEENFERADELEKKISGYQLYSGGGVWYADFLILENKIDEASDLTQQNLKICQSENWPADISRCHRVLSAICRKKKEYRKAEEHIRTSIEIAKKIGVSDLEIEALIESAKLYLEKKEYKSAIERADKIIRLCERTGFKLYEPDAELILSKAYLKENPQRSKHYAESAYKKAKDMGYHLPKAEAEQLLDKILSID